MGFGVHGCDEEEEEEEEGVFVFLGNWGSSGRNSQIGSRLSVEKNLITVTFNK